MDMCFELYQLMRSRGLSPSQVTYGILLDGFINDNEAQGLGGTSTLSFCADFTTLL